MNNFKDFLTDLVSEISANMEGNAVLESALDSRNYHSAIDSWCESHNDINDYKSDDFQKIITASSDRALSGYDSRYMNRNDWRVAKKFSHSTSLSTRKDNDDCKWDYLFASQGLERAKEAKVVTRQYNVMPEKASKASVKKSVIVGKGSYIPTSKPATNKSFEKDYRCKVGNLNTYRVVNAQFFTKAIVLEVESLDNKRATVRYDELSDYDMRRNEYFDIDSRNKGKNTFHIVFTYKVLENGKEAEYSGVNQLRNWLKTQKFVMEQKPMKVRDAVEMLIGETISLPSAKMFDYSSDDDKKGVYTVYGNFDLIEDELKNETNESKEEQVTKTRERKPVNDTRYRKPLTFNYFIKNMNNDYVFTF